MLPSRRDKVDLTKLTPDERRTFTLHGRIPPNKDFREKIPGRKFLDSGDSGNGHSKGHQVFSISPNNSTSPVNKESGLANNENTIVPDDEPLLESESVPESDLTKSTSDERRMYGKLTPRKDWKKLRGRKFFDSGDYALSKAGRVPQSIVGTAIPNPKNIPHASGNGHSNGHQAFSISPTNSTSPVNKESGLANNENTIVPDDEPLLETDSVPESVFKPVSAQGTVAVADSKNTET